MARSALIPLLLLGVSELACGHAPAAATRVSQESLTRTGTAAVEEVDGVRCSADGAAWTGFPANLGSDVIPMEIRIDNNSGRPIRLTYERFVLVGAGGREYYPLPLLPLSNKTGGVASLRPIGPFTRFFVAPRFSRTYGTIPPWPNPLPRDESLYQLDYRKWDKNLPTLDMMVKGIPEGVLEDGGTISGYLYFDDEARGDHDLVFKADVTEGDRERQVALITIPFRIE